MQPAVGAIGSRGHGVLKLSCVFFVAGVQLRCPLAVHRRDPVAGVLDHRAQTLRGRGEDFHGTAAVIPHLGQGVADAHEFGGLEYGWRAVGKLESSRRPIVSTTSASPITAPRMAPTTEGCLSGTRPRLSPVSR